MEGLMPVKRKSRKTRKLAAARAAPRRKILKPAAAEISPEEVVTLEQDAQSAKRSEQAWLTMSAASPDDDDKWSNVEEHLIAKPHESEHSARRWKHFSK